MKKTRQDEISRKGLFSSFRGLGLVCDGTKFVTSIRGGVGYVICSVGFNFHIYTLEKLELVFVGPGFSSGITALAAYDDYTFAAASDKIHIVERNVQVATLEVKKDAITSMMVLENLLLAVGSSSVYLFNLKDYSLIHMEHFSGKSIVSFYHPDTYLNKILISFSDGEFVLFNINSRKIVHTFSQFSGSALTCLVGSPDPDIAVAGFRDGKVAFFELKKAQVLFTLKINGAVSSIAFRTDELAHLAIGSSIGEVQVFDLDSRKLEYVIPAHARAVSSLWFVPLQPLLVTGSDDNSLKEYLFESNEYRCLRYRSGHYKPPTCLQFFGDDSRFLVSSGSDRSLRFQSIMKDNQSFEFSQGSTERIAAKLKLSQEDVKLPEIKEFDIFQTKTLKWDNMLTCHAGQSFAKTWRFDRKTIGQHTLETADKSSVLHVSISSCGNYGLLSTASGNIEVFNIQSGIRRRTMSVGAGTPIIASFTDSTCGFAVCVSSEGVISQFDFAKGKLVSRLSLGSPALKATINRETELFAVAGKDNTIRIVDYSAMRIVRQFSGHSSAITGLVFSSDSKWLLSCARDCTIRTWDLPTGSLIDTLVVEKAPVALALSKNMEFLASCHECDISVNVWSNRSLYAGDCNSVESSIIWTQSNQLDSISASNEVQCSEFPASRWKNIYFLEKIRSNTKPISINSTKKTALPFFLSQVMEQGKTQIEDQVMAVDENNTSGDDFLGIIEKCLADKDLVQFANYLQNLHPSKLDFEISCLPQEKKQAYLQLILAALAEVIKSGKRFELTQSILVLVLKHHEKFICENLSIFEAVLQDLLTQIKTKWTPLESLLQSSICLLSFVRDQ